MKLLKRAIKFTLFRVVYPLYYLMCSLRKVDERKVVFIELMSAELTPSFKLLHDELQEHYDLDVEVLLLNQLRMRYAKKLFLNFFVIRTVANAHYIFLDNTFPLISASPLRKETVVIQTWHGCGAFKKFGYSLVKGKTESSGWDYKMYPLHRHYDYVFVSGKKAVAPYADAFGMEKETEKIMPLGVSRTDVFFDDSFIEAAKEKLRTEIPATEGKKVLLYAPTYRHNVTRASLPVSLDINAMKEALGEDWVLLIKRHNFLRTPFEIPDDCRDFAFDVTANFCIDELLCTADTCISDYSSLVFEYALFEKPILFFVPDIEDYYSARGFYYDFEEFACGPILKTTQEVINAVGVFTDEQKQAVRAFKREFMDGCDGSSTKRILQTVFGPATK